SHYMYCYSYTNLPLPRSTLFPYTTLFRSLANGTTSLFSGIAATLVPYAKEQTLEIEWQRRLITGTISLRDLVRPGTEQFLLPLRDRKSTRLNSSHEWISYAVFCLKKKTTT